MYVIYVTRHILIRSDYVIPISMLPDPAVHLGEPLELKREGEFDSLNDCRKISLRTAEYGMKVVGEDNPRNYIDASFAACFLHGAAKEVGVFYQHRLPLSGDRGDKAALSRLEESQEF